MDSSTTRHGPAPNRTEALAGSYAIHVDDRRIAVWQYCVGISDPDGQWEFVETLGRESDPKLSIDHAIPMPPEPDGYWIYSTSYDCELDCE